MGPEKSGGILGMANKAIAANVIAPLRKQFAEESAALNPNNVATALCKEAERSGLLAPQDILTIEACYAVLKSDLVTTWVIQAARASAVYGCT